MNYKFSRLLGEYLSDRKTFAVATVIETMGSSSAKTGSKALIDERGKLVLGWVGGGCAESAVRQTAVECIKSKQTTVIEIDLNEEVLGVGMPCGGSMKVYIEPNLPKPTLWILGHGGIAEALSKLALLVGFEVKVHGAYLTKERYPSEVNVLEDDKSYKKFNPSPYDFAVVATQHKGDHESIEILLKTGVEHVALIASEKRAGLVLDYLKERGFSEEKLSKVFAPAGLDLGAKTPEEVAVSVISEVIMTRYAASGKQKSKLLRAK